MWFDCLVNNIDRHNENCGLLRDKKSGKIISLAPNFDNNLALISRSETLNLDANNDGLIKVFNRFLKSNATARDLYHSLKLPALSKDMIQDCFKKIDIKKDEKTISKYLLNRYNALKRL